MNVGFVGAGKVGIALGRYFVACGIPVTGYSSAHRASAVSAAECTKSCAFDSAIDVVTASDIVFLTTPDSLIAEVWHEIRKESNTASARRKGASDADLPADSPLAHKTICHCSGCLSSSIIDDSGMLGARAASMHPLCAISSPLIDLSVLERMHITLEGDAEAIRTLRELLSATHNPIHVIDASQKVLYHTAAVFASNLVLAPLEAAMELMERCGFDEAEARAALESLIRGNVDAFVAHGAEQALTGPVERNDAQTVAEHLAALEDADSKTAYLYATLTDALIDIARTKHPDCEYGPLAALLEQPITSTAKTPHKKDVAACHVSHEKESVS